MLKTRVRAVATAAATTLLVGVAGSALASDTTDVMVIGGTLTSTAVTATDFTDVVLDGTAKTTTAQLEAFSVTDATGTGAGWNVTVQGTQFIEHDGTDYVGGGKTLALGSLSLAAPSVTPDGTDSASPAITPGPYTVDDGSAVKIASAAVDAGMGTYDFGASAMTLSVPADSYARTYRSDVTVTVISAP